MSVHVSVCVNTVNVCVFVHVFLSKRVCVFFITEVVHSLWCCKHERKPTHNQTRCTLMHKHNPLSKYTLFPNAPWLLAQNTPALGTSQTLPLGNTHPHTGYYTPTCWTLYAHSTGYHTHPHTGQNTPLYCSPLYRSWMVLNADCSMMILSARRMSYTRNPVMVLNCGYTRWC